jgi:8-amino-7-oxononanoate synthase
MSLLDGLGRILKQKKAFELLMRQPLVVGAEITSLPDPSRVLINGREAVNLGSNNYLGMTHDKEALAACHAALDAWGRGATGARPTSGTFTPHKALEARLAQLYGLSHAILFSTGYQANLGTISALAGAGDTVLIDAESHASIFDAVRMSGATLATFAHNDPAALEKVLRAHPTPKRVLVVIEGIYSVLGDRAPVAKLLRVAKEFRATTLVDEAHAFGLYGDKGLGIAEADGAIGDADFIVGTFSKTIGTQGGFCVSRHDETEAIRLTSRPYLFTASSPPSVVAGAMNVIERLESLRPLREQAFARAARLRNGLRAFGAQVPVEPQGGGLIVTLQIDNVRQTPGIWNALLEANVYANMMGPPATPGNWGAIRMSVNTCHSEAQMDHAVGALHGILQKHRGMLRSAA